MAKPGPKPKYGDAPCVVCGTIFHKRNARARACSLTCRDVTLRKEQPTITCEVCATPFRVNSQYYVDGPKARRFCSPSCRHIGHRVPATPENIATKFWANVDKRGPNECWPWRLAPAGPGYGLVTLWKFKRTAHRVSYELHNGPIPKLSGSHGGCVLHRCDNRLCVNPSHLFLGTQGDNMRDMIAKGRQNWHWERDQAQSPSAQPGEGPQSN